MLTTEWNLERAQVIWKQEAREQGREEGREQGIEEGREKLLKELFLSNFISRDAVLDMLCKNNPISRAEELLQEWLLGSQIKQ